MKASRANSVAGVDLHLDLTGTGVRAGLLTALREAARTGRLAPGTRLPSSRSLAQDLGIARNTVAEAYGQLVAEGWLTARQGSGTTVAEHPAQPVRRTRAAVVPPNRKPARYSLEPGSPDVSMFPRAEWLAAARRALAWAPHDAFDYGDPRGRIELRRALSEYLARARGVRVDPERVLVCGGYVQGLSVLAATLRQRGGRTLAVEQVGYKLHWDVVRARGLRAVPLEVDEAGVRTELLGDERYDAALLTPAHQMPLGVALAPERRTAAIDWARSTGGLLIEDDYDGEFRYDRQPVGALQGLDPDHVVYIGTASKSLAPGLRLGWMVLPDRLIRPVAEAKRLNDLQAPVLDQLTLAEFLASGNYDRHVRRCRLHYRRRRDRLVATLAERVPQVRVTGIAAGLHALLEIPGRPADVVAAAATRGLQLSSLDRYRYAADPSGTQALVVGYGTPPDHAFTAAVDILCAVLT